MVCPNCGLKTYTPYMCDWCYVPFNKPKEKETDTEESTDTQTKGVEESKDNP